MLGPTAIQHVNRDDDALFAQHSFEDVDSFRFSEKDRLKIVLKYRNDNPYVFIVSAKDRHKLMCLLGGRIHLFRMSSPLIDHLSEGDHTLPRRLTFHPPMCAYRGYCTKASNSWTSDR